MKGITFCLAFLTTITVQAQFAPAAGLPGSTAILKDSAIFVGWVDSCWVERGWLDITTKLDRTSAGGPKETYGAPNTGIVSLGDSGVAVVTFAHALRNGPGPDFAVFENGLNDTFLELAFVEVSSNGQDFVRFPAVSHTDTTVQIDNWGGVMAEDLNNLASKYRSGFGTPFDLQELVGTPGLDVDQITHVRLVDVVGSIDPQYAQRDSEGNMINDPFPTPFPTGGFDLNAVGAIHWQGPPTGLAELETPAFSIFPNPIAPGGPIQLNTTSSGQLMVLNAQGVTIAQERIAGPGTWTIESPLASGWYVLHWSGKGAPQVQTLIVTP